MLNNQDITFDPLAQLASLKQQHGDKAEFLSKENFPFNAFDDIWTLNGLGNNGQTVNWSWLHSWSLSLDDQITLRLALADMATRLSWGSIHTMKDVLSHLQLSELTVTAFKDIWPTLTLSLKRKLSQFLIGLCAYDKEHFKVLHQWHSKLVIPNPGIKVYDPEKGALSDLENQAFNVGMNQRSAMLIERGFESKHTGKNQGLGKLASFRIFLAARFMQVLARRPSNLVQLKWADINPNASIFTDQEQDLFSDDDELKLRMFKAKRGGKFRQLPEGEPLILNYAVSKEVLHYRSGYLTLLITTLAAQDISLSNEELHWIFQCLPVFFTNALFKTKFRDKTQLFNAVSKNGTGFHMDKSLTSSLNNFFDSLNIVSERVGKFKVGNNRIRHTVGTNANRDNVHINKIAMLLGNTPASARIYVDLSDETRVLIDNNFVANDFLVKAFSTSVSDLLQSGEISIEDDFGHSLGKSKGVNQCSGCQRSKPIGCYGCNNFSALDSGDHRSQRDIAQQKYDYRIKSGDALHALLELKKQIRYIEATIIVCDQILQQKSTLESSNDQ